MQLGFGAGAKGASNYARIGFLIPPVPALRPNIIRNNQGHGIHVGRSSSAWIIGNAVVGNTGTGIAVDRQSPIRRRRIPGRR